MLSTGGALRNNHMHTITHSDHVTAGRVQTAAIVPDRSKALFWTLQVVWYAFAALEAVLAVRFLLRLFAANPNAGFTDFIYSLSAPFIAPFRTVFPASVSEGYVFEWGTLLAIAVYALIARGLFALLSGSRPVSEQEAHQTLKQTDTL